MKTGWGGGECNGIYRRDPCYCSHMVVCLSSAFPFFPVLYLLSFSFHLTLFIDRRVFLICSSVLQLIPLFYFLVLYNPFCLICIFLCLIMFYFLQFLLSDSSSSLPLLLYLHHPPASLYLQLFPSNSPPVSLCTLASS